MAIKLIRNKISFFFIIFILVQNSYPGQSYPKNYIALFGMVNFIQKSGSEADYIAGENDFPITPSYRNIGFGGGYFRFLSPRIFVGFDFQYNLKTKVNLVDPSDGEKIKIDTYENLFLFLNGGFDIIRSNKVILFFKGGAGINQTYGKKQEFISDWGNLIEIELPKRKTNFSLTGGLGSAISLKKKIGAYLNFQYTHIFVENPLSLFSPTMGIFFRF